MMDPQAWKENILEVIEEISNEDFQKETWFGNSDKVSSPEELYCNLLDDFIFEEFLENQDLELSEAQFSLGKALISKMKSFREIIFSYPDPQEILHHKDWQEIRLLASRFKQSFEV
jgi:hypothetical protein